MAFFSRSLNHSELNYHAVEKEAGAIIEAIRRWKQFLVGEKFTTLTDKTGIYFIFQKKNMKLKLKTKSASVESWSFHL